MHRLEGSTDAPVAASQDAQMSFGRASAGGSKSAPLELSVVMPCLNESRTLAICIQKIKATIERLGIRGEVIVADNGSTDGSQTIASDFGARVVSVQTRGYGSALRAGIAAARGEIHRNGRLR